MNQSQHGIEDHNEEAGTQPLKWTRLRAIKLIKIGGIFLGVATFCIIGRVFLPARILFGPEILLTSLTLGALVFGVAFLFLGLIGFGMLPFEEGKCQGCGYNLTGNESGKCPECGTEIDNP